jgi:hypothetical protein
MTFGELLRYLGCRASQHQLHRSTSSARDLAPNPIGVSANRVGVSTHQAAWKHVERGGGFYV